MMNFVILIMNKVSSNRMEVKMVWMLLLPLTMQPTSCHIGCDRRLNLNYYSTDNHFLKGYGFQLKNASSAVLCGRECSLNLQCESFNYHLSSHLCELNNASRAKNPADMVKLQGYTYYDENIDTVPIQALKTTPVSVTTTEAGSAPPNATDNVKDSTPKTAKSTEAASVPHSSADSQPAATTDTASVTDITQVPGTSKAVSASSIGTSSVRDTSVAETTHQVNTESTVEKTTTGPEATTSVEEVTASESAGEGMSTLGTGTASITHAQPDSSSELKTSSEAPAIPKSCKDLLLAGFVSNGKYLIYPENLPQGVEVYCDMETDGGGWIVFQRRQDGSVDFYRNWAEYQAGFGDLNGEFWLGNDILRTLTATGQWHLRIELTDWFDDSRWALYRKFAINGVDYRITVGLFESQTTGDSMSIHNGHPFTTKDRDYDTYGPWNCAVKWEGAWWFGGCFDSHLNGKYIYYGNVAQNVGIQWGNWAGFRYSFKKCSMKIRET